MSITRKSAQKLAKNLLDKTFKGVSRDVTFNNVTGSTYNTQSGQVEETVQQRIFSGILGPFNNNKFEVEDFVTGDVQFIVAFSKVDIPINTETRAIDDQGNTYKVINRFEDAVGATLTLQLRQNVRNQ